MRRSKKVRDQKAPMLRQGSPAALARELLALENLVDLEFRPPHQSRTSGLV
jgi:hypothetical protein